MHSRSSTDALGTPFVLVHGLMISSLYMIPLAEHLAATAAVHAIDLPGFGRSEGPLRAPPVPSLASTLSRWLDAKRIARCHLVAHSFGCQIAAEFAAQFPQRLASLTLIGPTIDPAAHSLPRQAWRLAIELLREPAHLWLRHLLDFIRAGPYRVLSMIGQMFADRIADKLPRIVVPSLVMRGARDPIAPENWIAEAGRRLPNARCLTVPDAAHCVHYTHPEECCQAILAFAANIRDER